MITGVVFSGSVDGPLRAYSTKTGKLLWDTDTAREFATVNGEAAHVGSLDAAGGWREWHDFREFRLLAGTPKVNPV